MHDGNHRIEKSEKNTKQKDSSGSSLSRLKGFRRALHSRDSTEGEPLRSLRVQDLWKQVEHLVKDKSPQVDLAQPQGNLDSQQLELEKHEPKKEERWKDQEMPTKTSERWEKEWDAAMLQEGKILHKELDKYLKDWQDFIDKK